MSRTAALLSFLALALTAAPAAAAPTTTGPATALPGFDVRVNAPWSFASGTSGLRAFEAAGDVNGDGRGDVLVRLSKSGSFATGAAYVVFGSSSRTAVQLETIGSRGFYVWSAGSSRLVIRPVGDVTGDGRADLLASPSPGGPYMLLFGRTATTPINLAALSAADGRTSADLPSRAGDFNGDGVADFLAASSGGTDIFFGRAGAPPSATPAYRVARSATGPCGDTQPRAAGDVNGDGLEDLVVGGGDSTTDVLVHSRVCVFYGQRGSATIDERTFTTTGQGFAINVGWLAAPFAGGYQVAGDARGAGDVDGDGFADIAVAKSWESPLSSRPASGSISIVRGGARSGLLDARSTNRLRVIGPATSTQLGLGPLTLFGIRDVTGDGWGEVVLQAGADTFSMGGRPLTGDADLANLGTTGLRVSGAQLEGPAGDVDGDGTTDVLLRGRVVFTGAL